MKYLSDQGQVELKLNRARRAKAIFRPRKKWPVSSPVMFCDDVLYRILIVLGVLTASQTYTCPVLSIHTYYQSSKKTEVDYAAAQFSNKKKYDRQLGPLATSKEEQLSSDETVIMIPVEDVINIYYTSDVKKSVKAEEHSRLVPVVAQKGCCGGCCKKSSGTSTSN